MKAMPHARRFGGVPRVWVPAAIAALLCGTVARCDDTGARRFVWDQANARMSTARMPGDFLEAAAIYRRLIDMGARSGHVFYNHGTALLKAGRHGEALESLLRAERYLGNHPDVRRNMALAAKALEEEDTASLPWYRPILFWHYSIGAGQRLGITVVAFAALWLGFILRSIGARRLAARLLAVSLVVLVLFGSSAATSLHMEARSDAHGSAVMDHTSDETQSKGSADQ